MKKYIIIGIVIVVAGAIAMGGNGDTSNGNQTTSSQNDSNSGTKLEVKPVVVETVPVKYGNIKTYITETGITSPMKFAVISSEVSGKLMSIRIEVGQLVSKNEAIAQIDDELSKFNLDMAKADKINTSASLEKSSKDIERYKNLLDKNQISSNEYETFKLQNEQARAADLSADAALKIAERRYKNTTIIAPYSGMISAKHVQQGDMISVNTPIVKIVDISKIRININLSDKDIVSLRTGMNAEVEVDAYPGERFDGKIFTISPESNSSSHTFPVEILVSNPDKKLKSGMVTRVKIATKTVEDALVIPRDAVIERFGKYIVFIAAGGKAVEKKVILGISQDKSVQILSGLELGDNVIHVGHYTVEDGAKITIK